MPQEVCTKCGESLTFEDINNGLKVEFHLGYFTDYDLEKLNYKFCIKCTNEEVKKKIDDCIHNPLEDYNL